MNKVILMGRLTRDPDIRYTQDTMCIARYTLAVDRMGKKQEGQPTADFINCVAFSKAGEFVEKYVKKGTKLAVTGRIQTGSYKNKNGETVYTTEVIIESQEFAESKNTHGNAADNPENTPQQKSSEGLDGFMNIPDNLDQQLPFA